jgi:hypothetical protein
MLQGAVMRMLISTVTRAMGGRTGLVLGALLILGGVPEIATAHVMPAHQGTIAMRGRHAYVALSLPAMMFREADDDRDGRLSVAEVVKHAELLQRLVATRVHVGDKTNAARLVHAQVIVERLDDDTAAVQRPATDVLVLVVAEFDRNPASVRLSIDGLDAVAAGNGADAARITVRASHADVPGAGTESATLRPGHSSVRFFGSAWSRAIDSALQSAGHILGEPDHLLLLVTLAIAGAGWRYWGRAARASRSFVQT